MRVRAEVRPLVKPMAGDVSGLRNAAWRCTRRAVDVTPNIARTVNMAWEWPGQPAWEHAVERRPRSQATGEMGRLRRSGIRGEVQPSTARQWQPFKYAARNEWMNGGKSKLRVEISARFPRRGDYGKSQRGSECSNAVSITGAACSRGRANECETAAPDDHIYSVPSSFSRGRSWRPAKAG